MPVSVVGDDAAAPSCALCGGALAVEVSGGERFELEERIGAGTFGSVWRARDRKLGRVVAIKLLHPATLLSTEARARFEREARTVARLRHPGIVAVHEVTELAGRPVMVTDLVDGVTIDSYRAGRPLTPREAATLIRQAAEAIDYAHSMGVVHRDLKPANLMIERAPEAGNPRLVVLDFGLALVSDGGGTLTMDGQLLGTPAYMSPEQAAGGHAQVDPRSDVYSLGAVLYELLTGTAPYRGTGASILQQLLRGSPPPPRRVNPHLPPDLDSICRKAMASSPRDRYAAARALAEDLGRFLDDLPVRARPLNAVERTQRWVRREPVTAGLIGLILVLMMAVTIGSILSVVRLRREREAALENLYTANLEEARARRTATSPGRHFETMRVLERARRRHPSLAVRNELIATLPLVDLEVEHRWRLRSPGEEQNFGLAFDAAFHRCAVQKENDSLRVFALPESTQIRCLPPAGSGLHLSPQGRFLLQVGARGGEFRLYDLQEDRIVTSGRTCAWTEFGAFSDDSSRVTLCLEEGTFVSLELPSGRELRRVRAALPPNTVAVDRLGRRVAYSEGEGVSPIRIADLVTGEITTPWPEAVGHPWAWSPDGDRLLVRMEGSVEILDLRTGSRLPLQQGPADTQEGSFHPTDGLLVTRAWDGYSRLWDASTGEQLLAIAGHYVRWSGDGACLGFGSGAEVGWWRAARGGPCRTMKARDEIGDGPYDVAISSDGLFLATPSGDGARLWDASSGKVLAHLQTGRTIGAAFDAAGTTLLTLSATGLQAWPLARDARERRIRIGPARMVDPHRFDSGGVSSAFSPDGRWAVAKIEANRALRVELATGDTLSVGPHPGIDYAAISPDGAWIATATKFGEGILVWEAASRSLRLKLEGGRHGRVAFSANGRWLLTESMGYPVSLWEVPSFALHRRIVEGGAGCFVGSGDVLAFRGVSGEVILTTAQTGAELARLESPRGQGVAGVSTSSDAAWLAMYRRHVHVLELWDLGRLRQDLAAWGLDWDARPPAAPGTRVTFGAAEVLTSRTPAEPAARSAPALR